MTDTVKKVEEDRYPGAEEIENLWKKMEAIEEKHRCVRVRFLDWLAVKLLAWSKAVQDMSNRIDSPCAIKLPAKEEKPSIAHLFNVKLGKKK